jgi:hypothetical protein
MLVVCQVFSAMAGINAMTYKFERVSYRKMASDKHIAFEDEFTKFKI